MKTTELRQAHPSSVLIIAESTKTYEMTLCVETSAEGIHLNEPPKTYEPRQLFQVETITDGGMVTRFVLAENEEGALGQVSCEIKGSSFADVKRSSFVRRQSLLIRGWSGTEF